MKKLGIKRSVTTILLVAIMATTACAGFASAKTKTINGIKVEYSTTFTGKPWARSYTNSGRHYASVSTSTGKYAKTTADCGWTSKATVSPGTLGFYTYWVSGGIY